MHFVHLLSAFQVQIVSCKLIVKHVAVSFGLTLIPYLHFLNPVVVSTLPLLIQAVLEVTNLLDSLLDLI